MSAVPTLTAMEPPGAWAAPDPYPLRALLFCSTCDQPFFPSTQADGTRTYRSLCGCRLRPVDAAETEHRVYAETQCRVFGTVAAIAGECLADLAVRLFVRVTLTPTGEDIAFTARIPTY
jgi:hypothetical protein